MLDSYQIEGLQELLDVQTAISSRFEKLSERISTKDGKLYLDGEELHGSIVENVTRSLAQGITDVTPHLL